MGWVAVPLVAALWGACAAQSPWTNPGMTKPDLARAEAECRTQARAEVRPRSIILRETVRLAIGLQEAAEIHAEGERHQAYERCMETKGYRRR